MFVCGYEYICVRVYDLLCIWGCELRCVFVFVCGDSLHDIIEVFINLLTFRYYNMSLEWITWFFHGWVKRNTKQIEIYKLRTAVKTICNTGLDAAFPQKHDTESKFKPHTWNANDKYKQT